MDCTRDKRNSCRCCMSRLHLCSFVTRTRRKMCVVRESNMLQCSRAVHTIRMVLSLQNWKDNIIGVWWSVLSQTVSLLEEIKSRALEKDKVKMWSNRKITDVSCGGPDCNPYYWIDCFSMESVIPSHSRLRFHFCTIENQMYLHFKRPISRRIPHVI